MTIDKTYTAVAEEHLDAIVTELVPLVRKYKVLVLYGDLGAGKTTIVAKLAAAFGSANVAASPTFAYVHRYTMPNGSLYHFDLYRLPSKQAWYAHGFDDLLQEPGAIACIEWPAVIVSALQRPFLQLTITPTSATTRELWLQTIEG
ncbi:tRNA (adenosine(37)-N6)-threonylcarbamoyltransferase complex ATPase subunit type 1 TsaE [Candidatus Dependentiae bacterium]|nr:tRNA (adenosine(37)-N6)-threonylcarbamoyltransferase complex ATPase subunit type 1 TsaE [Candidatus Dependentiae bacterium]